MTPRPLANDSLAGLCLYTDGAVAGTHSTPEQWVERQTGGALTSDELDRLLGLQSQVIRTSGTLEIEYKKVAPCLALWKAKALPAVREKLLVLFAWISAEDGQHKPMGQM